jgi:hypothetical protein
MQLGRIVVCVAASGAVAFPALGCSSSSPSSGGAACGQPVPDGGPVQMRGKVVDLLPDGGTVPVANAMVAVEYGGLYIPWCDLSKASPYYLFGSVTDDAGAFTVSARTGVLGFHGFATRQFYSRARVDTSQGTQVTITLSPQPDGQARPTVTGAAFDKTSVSPGAMVTLSATVRAGSSSDPLSDETIVVEPTHSWALELNPPSLGKKDDFPDGTWSRTFAAPADAGTYTFWLSATSAGCVTSDLVQLTLVVQ